MAHTKTGPTVAEVVALEDQLLAKDAETDRLTRERDDYKAMWDDRNQGGGVMAYCEWCAAKDAEIDLLRERDPCCAAHADSVFRKHCPGCQKRDIERLTRERDELREALGRIVYLASDRCDGIDWIEWADDDWSDLLVTDSGWEGIRALLDKEER